MDDTTTVTPREGTAILYEPPAQLGDDPRWITAYHAMVDGLQTDAMGLSMGSLQSFLLERIATYSVLIKFHDASNDWTAASRKDMHAQWLAFTAEYNKVAIANQDKRIDAKLDKALSIVQEALKDITDPDERKKIRLSVTEQFAELGL